MARPFKGHSDSHPAFEMVNIFNFIKYPAWEFHTFICSSRFDFVRSSFLSLVEILRTWTFNFSIFHSAGIKPLLVRRTDLYSRHFTCE